MATGSDGQSVTCTWRGSALPWTLTRTILVRRDGAVEARYEALATGRDRLPFLWSATLRFPLDSRTRLRMPDGVRMRVDSANGASVRASGEEKGHRWPRLTFDGQARDLGSPWALPRETLVSAWLDLGKGRAALQLWQGDERVTLTCDGAGVPFCGLVIDRSGTGTGGARQGMFGGAKRGAPALAIRPSLGAPDRYADALGDWKAVTWLVPGEPRRWTMTLRGGS